MSAVAIVAAAVFGTRKAAQINAEASKNIARLNAKTSTEIEEIKARSQRTLELDRDRRQWRRERTQPMLQHLAELSGRSQAAMTLDGKPWQEAQVVLDNLDRALRAQPTRELLIAPIPTSLHDKLTILHAREAGWVDAFRERFTVNRAADSSIDLIPRPPWVENGLEGEYGDYARIGERTCRRLVEYKREERGTGTYFDHRQVRRMHITANGRALYHDRWACYRELYPDIEAIEPRAGLRTASA